MRDFAYFGQSQIPLSDEIIILNQKSDEKFLVCNDKSLQAEIYASEIDFYLKNSTDSALNIAKNIEILYKARSIAFDLATYQKQHKKVGKNILIINANERKSLQNLLENNGFSVLFIKEIKFIYGLVGELCVILEQDGEEIESICDFALINNAQDYMLRQSGCIEISTLSDEEILEFLKQHSPFYEYQNYVTNDSNLCLYHHKRGEICALCQKVCPSVAIMKNDEEKELEFSAIDCVACGSCVGICPSGAMEQAVLTRKAFGKISKLYSKKIPLILKDNEFPNLKLEKNILPFIIPASNMLDFDHLLSLVLGVNGAVIIYLKQLNAECKETISLANEIFKAAFKKELIFYAKNENELEILLKKEFLQDLPNFDFNENLPKFLGVANKLELITNNKNLGEFKTFDSTAHAKIVVNNKNCTLCASCVAACVTGALIADSANNSLCFNESLCVGCDYCVQSCAEKDTIFMQKGKMQLCPEFFQSVELARDELFACVECGKEFATKKAVQKVANLLKENFVNDEMKLKSLYCCADCKAKLALQKQLSMQGIL